MVNQILLPLFTDPYPCICSKFNHVKSSAIILGIQDIHMVPLSMSWPLPTLLVLLYATLMLTLCTPISVTFFRFPEGALLPLTSVPLHILILSLLMSPELLFSQFLPHFQLPAQLSLINTTVGFSIQVCFSLKDGTSPTTCCFLPEKRQN